MLAYLHDLSPFLFQLGEGFGLRWYGLAYAGAFLSGYFLYAWLSRRGYADIQPAQVGDFVLFWVVLGTVIGGRLGYMLFYNLDEFLRNPISLLFVWQGGMSAHGGILGLVAATWLYARKYRMNWFNVGDNLVVTAPIGLCFGRLANFINGELYGKPASVPWAVQFPKEILDVPPVRAEAARRAQEVFGQPVQVEALIDQVRASPEVRGIMEEVLTPRHPSQLYEALGQGVLLFALLFILRTGFRLPNGVLTGVFFIGYAVFRIGAEFFREPDAPLILAMSRGQFFSLFLILIGLAFVGAAWRKPVYPVSWSRSGAR